MDHVFTYLWDVYMLFLAAFLVVLAVLIVSLVCLAWWEHFVARARERNQALASYNNQGRKAHRSRRAEE